MKIVESILGVLRLQEAPNFKKNLSSNFLCFPHFKDLHNLRLWYNSIYKING